MNEKDTKDIKAVLTFWFEEVSDEQKFEKDEQLDREIVECFEDTYWRVMQGETESWRETPDGRLAEIIVLDQFARNMFRDTAQAFAGDELALRLAEEAVANGHDQAVSEEKRLFFYMPYMHSESPEVHEKALKLFQELGREKNLKYERMHKAIIDRFGRYPYRNEVLGRASTPEELEWLKDNEGF